MLRLLGAGAVITAGTAIGFSMERELANRVKSLREIEHITDILKAEIRYAGTPLQEVFRGTAERVEAPFSDMLREAADEMELRDGKTLGKIWGDCILRLPGDTGLTQADKREFSHLGERLGYLDGQMQIRTLERYKEELEREQKEAEADYRQKVRVYRCLGFLGGVFLTLLLM